MIISPSAAGPANMLEGVSSLDSFPLFDENFEKKERLPRTFHIELAEAAGGRGLPVQMKIKGTIVLGVPLIDYSAVEDGYRFHDVMHVAFLAMLGWSPVLRTLMGRTRRSIPAIYDVEDGGRATIIEEALVSLIHNHVGLEGLLGEVTSIDPTLLHTIRELTGILEVRRYETAHWEQTILAGLGHWRQFLQHRRGVLVGNLVRRTLVFEAMPEGTVADGQTISATV